MGCSGRTTTVESHAPSSRPVVSLETDLLDTLLGHHIAGREQDLANVISPGRGDQIAECLRRS